MFPEFLPGGEFEVGLPGGRVGGEIRALGSDGVVARDIELRERHVVYALHRQPREALSAANANGTQAIVGRLGVQLHARAFGDRGRAFPLEGQPNFAVVGRVLKLVGDEFNVLLRSEETSLGDHVAHPVAVAKGIGGEGFELVVHVIPSAGSEQNQRQHDGDGLRPAHHLHERQG